MIIAVDIETHDPYLKTWGPGTIRGDGYIIGVGFYCPELKLNCFLRPEDPKVRDILASKTDKVFHNGVYDVDWLMNGSYHFEVNGRIEDTMTRETLLDAYDFSYALDHCCDKRGVVGKNKEDTIDRWWAAQGNRSKAIEHLKDIPFDIVGKYCIQDCKATWELYHAQQPLLEEQELLHANDIEVRLYPWLMETRRNGMIIDWDKRRKLSDDLNAKLEEYTVDFTTKYGDVNTNSAKELESLWKHLGLPIVYTDTGKPSFTHDILADCTHPVASEILKIRSLSKLLSTFVDGQFVDLSYVGRIWPILYPAKRTDGGTVTGRFSSQYPNGQNIPAREDKYGKEIRSLFIPEDDCILGAFDYKQIEYRVFMHFAVGPGAEEAREKFRKEEIDYHQMVQDMMGWSFPDDPGKMKSFRHVTKNLNFGSIYGLGPKSFAERFKYPLMMSHPDVDPANLLDLAKSLQDEYYRKISFAKPTCNKIQEVASRRGYVKTVAGRRQRVTADGKLYKLVNYLIQGSAGDIFKKAMVDSWEAGVWEVLISHIMVHDEEMFSIPKTKTGYEAAYELAECMKNAYTLNIPLGVDTEIGPDWGHCTNDNWIEFGNSFKGVING